jgi:hypothetical protein
MSLSEHNLAKYPKNKLSRSSYILSPIKIKPLNINSKTCNSGFKTFDLPERAFDVELVTFVNTISSVAVITDWGGGKGGRRL